MILKKIRLPMGVRFCPLRTCLQTSTRSLWTVCSTSSWYGMSLLYKLRRSTLNIYRRDARKLPGTVRVANPYAQPEESNVPPESSPRPQSVPTHLRPPSEEWRRVFEYRFNNFRKVSMPYHALYSFKRPDSCSCLSQNFNQTTTSIGPILPVQSRLMPEKKDRDLWWAFLSGRPEDEWTPIKKGKGKQKRLVLQQSTSGTSQARSAMDGAPPTTDGGGNAADNGSWNNDEGEVEEFLRLNPAETLPSPVGTPVPLDYLERMAQPSATPTVPIEDRLIPRECNTQLLKLIDEVRVFALFHFMGLMSYHSELHCISSCILRIGSTPICAHPSPVNMCRRIAMRAGLCPCFRELTTLCHPMTCTFFEILPAPVLVC